MHPTGWCGSRTPGRITSCSVMPPAVRASLSCSYSSRVRGFAIRLTCTPSCAASLSDGKPRS
eukprot:7167688-Prymnesium_polylepis.1